VEKKEKKGENGAHLSVRHTSWASATATVLLYLNQLLVVAHIQDMGTTAQAVSTGAALLDGDADEDGDVDGDDFLMWQNSFPYPTALSKTPEPASLGLVALGGLLMLRRRAI